MAPDSPESEVITSPTANPVTEAPSANCNPLVTLPVEAVKAALEGLVGFLINDTCLKSSPTARSPDSVPTN